MANQYKVFITPRTNLFTYGDEVDVSDYVIATGMAKIRSQIDAEDYNVGVFSYDDLTMRVLNRNGYFNEETDNRSIFKFSRDQAKVRIVFSQITYDDVSGTVEEQTMSYQGLINEEATKLNTETEEMEFKVLSRDSVIRNTEVAGGLITDGMSVKSAIIAIMNQTSIAAVLTTTAGNVNPDLNFTIDLGEPLSGISAREAMNQLLRSSNSVMIIDDDGIVTVKDRTEDSDADILNLYGPYDIYRRQNTIRMLNYGTGKHRMYNSFNVNNEVKTNAGYQMQFGFRQYEDITFDFITEAETAADIAENLLEEFAFPKLECEVEVPWTAAPTVRLLNRVSLNWPLLLKPWPGSFFPIVGITKIGSTDEKLPIRLGSVDIQPNIAWKVIQIEEDPQKFTKTLKLRQAGKSIADGYFTQPKNSIIGFAVIGDGIIGGTGTVSYNPSVVGAAVIGNTKVS